MSMSGENKARLIVFLCLLSVFMLMTFLMTNTGLDDGPEHNTRVASATLGTIAGPMTGAIARGFQECCLEFSMSVMKFCAPVLAIGVAAQFLPLPDRTWARYTKLMLWAVGWLVWLGGGIVSFGHALA